MKTALEIRQAMIQIAERKNRPHYTAMVVRDVIYAIQNNLDHPLKAEVLAEGVQAASIARPKTNLELIKEFCSVRGISKYVAKHAGISESYLAAILKQERALTSDVYQKIKSAFSRAETEFANTKTKKKETHGTTNCYKNGCRCVECCSAMQESNESRLRQMTEKYAGATA